MDLHTYLSLFATAAIVFAGIFAGVQLRQLYKQRSRESALQLLRSFQTPEFTDAVNFDKYEIKVLAPFVLPQDK